MRLTIFNEEEEDDDLDMPCPCTECGDVFDLTDGREHPRKENHVICEPCSYKIEAEVEREEEIENLLSEIKDAEWTIDHSKKRLKELNYKAPNENGE